MKPYSHATNFSRAHLGLLREYLDGKMVTPHVRNLLHGADLLDHKLRPTKAAKAALAELEQSCSGPEVAS